MTRKEELVSIYWDFYKEVHGIRPRWIDFESIGEQEMVTMLDSLDNTAKIVFAEREAAEQARVVEFEAGVQTVMSAGGHQRSDVLRWLMDASGANGDWDYFSYLNGLPYKYFKEL